MRHAAEMSELKAELDRTRSGKTASGIRFSTRVLDLIAETAAVDTATAAAEKHAARTVAGHKASRKVIE